ncbi:hypothetical protein [uncultured Kordia sp.]|uniref:hypothetical protein n=1 Tax=uncultured Kordia sp. TaxID=507699 RepID=UPI0026219E89|nr:hypothetical protein [uncultured Kordia sp.]
MKKKKKFVFNWKKYFFETLSMFIAVVSAFALSNWSQDRRDSNAEREILKAVVSALNNDLITIENNKLGNIFAKKSCVYLRDLINNKPVNQDSIQDYYNNVFADFSFTPNKTGYEGLTSKGLDIIKDDLLRVRITYYYNYYFDVLTKIEEQNEAVQAFKNYFFPINNVLANYMEFNDKGELIEIKQPIEISELDKKKIYSYLWQLESSREFKIMIYTQLETQLKVVQQHVKTTLDEMD